ncbi:hypothetical protein QTP70_015318, partial [Hemibagrus guttatus]
YKRHLSTTSNSQTPNSTMAKTKELSKDTRNKIVDLHQAGKTESAIDPVQTVSFLDPGLMCDDATQTDSAVPEESVSEAEEKSQKGEVSSSLLDSERSILEERVRELEELLCEAQRECERKHKVTLAEPEEKHEQATESVDQLQKQDADLMSQVDTLQDTVQELANLLAETHTECTDTTRLYETELNIRKRMQSEFNQKEENFNQEISSLRDTLTEAERKYEHVMESNAHLEIKNSKLWSDVRLMQDAMLELDKELSLTRIHCNEITRECALKKRELNNLQSKQNGTEETLLKECECEKETHSVLKFDKMTSTHHEELLHGIQDETKRLYRKVTTSHDHLKRDEELNKLRESVQQLERELSESFRKCEERKRECEREKEAHNVLKCDKMTSTHLKELLQGSQAEAEEKFEFTAQLENENSDLKSQVKTLQGTLQGLSSLLAETCRKCEKAKEKSLNEAERKYGEAMERNTQQENDNFDMITQMHSMAEEVNELTEHLSVAHGRLEQTMQELEHKTRQFTQLDSKWQNFNETVIKDHEVECVAHRVLKVKYSEMKEQHDKLQEECKGEQEAHHVLNVQCHEMKEPSHTDESVNREQSSVQQLEEKLAAIRRKCNEIKMERKREQEDYNLLKARCQDMEKTFQECEELLRWSDVQGEQGAGSGYVQVFKNFCFLTHQRYSAQ